MMRSRNELQGPGSSRPAGRRKGGSYEKRSLEFER